MITYKTIALSSPSFMLWFTTENNKLKFTAITESICNESFKTIETTTSLNHSPSLLSTNEIYAQKTINDTEIHERFPSNLSFVSKHSKSTLDLDVLQCKNANHNLPCDISFFSCSTVYSTDKIKSLRNNRNKIKHKLKNMLLNMIPLSLPDESNLVEISNLSFLDRICNSHQNVKALLLQHVHCM